MIKHVNGRNHITVYNSSSPPYISPGSQSAGMVRYNTSMSELEVYDGSSWRQLSSSVDIGLNSETEMILDWARQKMLEEKKLDELCKKYPGLDKARANFETFRRIAEAEAQIQPS